MALGTFGLAFLAGLLSILSPCVLPLLPLVLGTAASAQRGGAVALAFGVALSFVAIGLFVATVGFAIGLDGDLFRSIAAVLMILVGLVLAVPVLQTALASAGGPISNWANKGIERIGSRGLLAQFAIGLLLGAVWSPCVGPTLGAASVLAAQSRSLPQVAVTMAAFGIGAALPLALVGTASRQAVLRWRSGLMRTSATAKILLGLILILFGLLALTGLDKKLETVLVEASPQWLTDLTTRF